MAEKCANARGGCPPPEDRARGAPATQHLRRSVILGPLPYDGDAVSDRQDHLLQLRVAADPLVEVSDRVAEVTACRLCVEVLVDIWVAVVEDIIRDYGTPLREEPVLQDEFHIPPVLGLVRVNEHQVKLALQLGQRLQSRTNDHLMAVRHLWEGLEAGGKPTLEV